MNQPSPTPDASSSIEELAARLREELRSLPVEAQQRVEEQLAHVLAAFQTDQDVDPLAEFLQRLSMTLAAQRTSEFRKGLKEADADAAHPPARRIGLGQMLGSVGG
jgi:hypothetical protein